ncbi:PAS domain-containing sensor histidine kinase [Methanoculleus taiwanensis]|uniref:PAS domain-containing sensor histidine kinase n=1 Tax=Methanoculleus taiwanensis TaxID=1550565 RepID=UPI000FFF1949|nr:PAS domain-containing protein [Methanoculleus taiwanensis]
MNYTETLDFDPLQAFSILGEPSIGILVLDRDRNVLWCNDAVRDIIGIPPDTAIGKNALQIIDTYLLPRLQDPACAHCLRNLLHAETEPPPCGCLIHTASGETCLLSCSCQYIPTGPFQDMIVIRFRDICRQESFTRVHAHKAHLTLLSEISRLFETEGLSAGEILTAIAGLLPTALRYPDQAYARIVLGDTVHGRDVPETPWRLTADLIVHGNRDGVVEVGYTKQPPGEAGEVFLREESVFLHLAAGMIGRLLGRLQTAEVLERQTALLDLTHDAVTVWGMDGRITFWNRAAEEEYGWRGDEALGQVTHDLLQTHFPTSLESSIAELVRTGHWEGELVKFRRDGSRVVVATRWALQRGSDGKPLSILEINSDITGRKCAEAEIRMRNSQLAVLNQIITVSASALSFDELMEASLSKTMELLDFDLGVAYLLDSERTRALPKYRRGTPASLHHRQRFVSIHNWPYNFVFIAGQARYFEQQEQLGSMEAELLREYGVRALAAIPLVAESVVVGAIFVGSREKESFSLPEKNLLEAIGKEIGAGVLRSMLHKKLEAANREANLYIDILTHDIRNAENVASLYSDLLVEMLEGSAAEYADKVRTNIMKGTEIIKHVSTIRKVHQEPVLLRPVHLDSVARDELRDIPNVTLQFRGSVPEVWADEFLGELFKSLVGSRIRYIGPDAAITVTVEESSDEVLVSVEDSGPGVPDEVKEDIFHRFEPEKGLGTGTYLGLYAARLIVERYDGRIWVEDRVEGSPELGAAFRFTLRAVLPEDRNLPGYEETLPGEESRGG